MKKGWMLLSVFCVCLFVANSSNAQKEDDFVKEIRGLFWGPSDEHSEDVAVPEKWKDESAVILYQKILYRFTRLKSYKFVEGEGIRRRIKLQDQSAIDEYSEFTVDNPFQSKMSKSRKWMSSIAEVKIIKQNGDVKEVDMSQGVSVDGGTNKQKVAIPGLEPGDILDFFYYTGNERTMHGKHGVESSSPVISTLSANYPIVEQLLQFEVDEKNFFSGNSYNGAPNFKSKTGTDGQRIYYLIDKNREKDEEIRWYYERIESPTVKYQATVMAKENRSDKNYNFLGQPGLQHEGFNTNEYISLVKDNWKFTPMSISDKEDKRAYKELNNRDFLEYIYNKTRFAKVGKFLEPLSLVQNDIYTQIYMSFYGFPTSKSTVSVMGGYLVEMDIPFEFILVPPRNVSTLDNILLIEEVEYLIRAEIEGESYYLPSFYTFNEFNRIPDYLEGAEALSFMVDTKGEVRSGKKVTLPISSHRKNNTERTIRVDLSDLNSDGFSTSRNTKVVGLSKEYYQNSLLTINDHNSIERKKYVNGPYLANLNQNQKIVKNAVKKYEEFLDQQKSDQLARAEEILRDEVSYDIKKFENLEISSVGRLDNKILAFEENYTIDPSFIRKAGKNYLIPVGQLIDDQVAIQEEEKSRTKNIYMPFARSFTCDIEVKLPEGFQVDGLEKLNKSVENVTGGFKAKTTFENSILKIRTEKWYEHNYEESEKWPDMIEFLDAAFQFTQEKILLKQE